MRYVLDKSFIIPFDDECDMSNYLQEFPSAHAITNEYAYVLMREALTATGHFAHIDHMTNWKKLRKTYVKVCLQQQ